MTTFEQILYLAITISVCLPAIEIAKYIRMIRDVRVRKLLVYAKALSARNEELVALLDEANGVIEEIAEELKQKRTPKGALEPEEVTSSRR